MSLRVWNPTDDSVALVSASDCVPIEDAPPAFASSAVVAATVGKINDAISRNMLLAPLDASVIPLPHQIAALHRTVAQSPVRMLLADEVGLGKTIEAGLIIRELKLRGRVKRVLVVAPKGLVSQWVSELETHFNESFELVLPSDFSSLRIGRGESNRWRHFDQVVTAMDSVKPLAGRAGWSRQQVDRYNRERFDSLVAAGWDLVIVDEAHRLAGADDGVARYELGRGLAKASTHLLLLSATPHSGKTDAFHRLVSLMDERAFPTVSTVTRDRVLEYVVRTEKRAAVDIDDRPIFQPRVTRLLAVEWGEQHRNEQHLYEAVTAYVREGYDRAVRERQVAAGFLLLLFQRLVTSSTQAIRSTLERRLVALGGNASPDDDDGALDDILSDLDDSSVMLHPSPISAGERTEVESLLELARQAERAGPDAKSVRLLNLIADLESEELDPNLKVLIFTEFTETQRMLRTFFETRGYSTAILNGSMDIDDRRSVQSAFSEGVRVLISTEAGGEGSNLQFCHVVVNYDLPWNPMRIEQRIGRVDRIGQRHPVRAFNLVLGASVEHRLQEVLEKKLKTILDELGVDKLADVLDSGDVNVDFESLHVDAILHPDDIDRHVDSLTTSIRERAAASANGASILRSPDRPDPTVARSAISHPLPSWVQSLAVNAALDDGGDVRVRSSGFDIRWSDGEEWNDVVFRRTESDLPLGSLVTLSEPRLQMLLQWRWRQVPGQPVSSLRVSGLVSGVSGFWSLWRLTVVGGNQTYHRYLPLFLHDNNTILIPSAQRIWDALVDPDSVVQLAGVADETRVKQAWNRLEEAAWTGAHTLVSDVSGEHSEWLRRERASNSSGFSGRRELATQHHQRSVQERQLEEIDDAERQSDAAHHRAEQLATDMSAMLLVHVEPLG